MCRKEVVQTTVDLLYPLLYSLRETGEFSKFIFHTFICYLILVTFVTCLLHEFRLRSYSYNSIYYYIILDLRIFC